MKINAPFYSEALKGWRIENEEIGESIVVYTESQAWEVYHLAQGKSWHAATRREREINLQRQREKFAADEAARRQQQESPR